MSHRLLFLLVILVFAGMACNITRDRPKPSGLSMLEEVVVSPSSGSGMFSIYMTYLWNQADPGYAIKCELSGRGEYLKTISVPITHENKWSTSTITISITEPGSYNVRCQDTANNSISNPFEVVAKEEQPSSNAGVTKPASPSGPIYINGTGTVTLYYYDVSTGQTTSNSFPANGEVLLTVNTDNSTVLWVEYTVPGSQSSKTSWLMNGIADPANETVTFTSCNSGNFTAQGKVTGYISGNLAGEVSCTVAGGANAGEKWFKIYMP